MHIYFLFLSFFQYAVSSYASVIIPEQVEGSHTHRFNVEINNISEAPRLIYTHFNLSTNTPISWEYISDKIDHKTDIMASFTRPSSVETRIKVKSLSHQRVETSLCENLNQYSVYKLRQENEYKIVGQKVLFERLSYNEPESEHNRNWLISNHVMPSANYLSYEAKPYRNDSSKIYLEYNDDNRNLLGDDDDGPDDFNRLHLINRSFIPTGIPADSIVECESNQLHVLQLCEGNFIPFEIQEINNPDFFSNLSNNLYIKYLEQTEFYIPRRLPNVGQLYRHQQTIIHNDFIFKNIGSFNFSEYTSISWHDQACYSDLTNQFILNPFFEDNSEDEETKKDRLALVKDSLQCNHQKVQSFEFMNFQETFRDQELTNTFFGNINSLAYYYPILSKLDISGYNKSGFFDYLEHLNNLKELNLSNCDLGSEHINNTTRKQWLRNLPHLRNLDLSNNNLQMKSFEILENLQNPQNLKYLDLSSNSINLGLVYHGYRAKDVLSHFTSLTHLDLSKNRTSSFYFIAQVISGLSTNLQDLNISSTYYDICPNQNQHFDNLFNYYTENLGLRVFLHLSKIDVSDNFCYIIHNKHIVNENKTSKTKDISWFLGRNLIEKQIIDPRNPLVFLSKYFGTISPNLKFIDFGKNLSHTQHKSKKHNLITLLDANVFNNFPDTIIEIKYQNSPRLNFNISNTYLKESLPNLKFLYLSGTDLVLKPYWNQHIAGHDLFDHFITLIDHSSKLESIIIDEKNAQKILLRSYNESIVRAIYIVNLFPYITCKIQSLKNIKYNLDRINTNKISIESFSKLKENLNDLIPEEDKFIEATYNSWNDEFWMFIAGVKNCFTEFQEEIKCYKIFKIQESNFEKNLNSGELYNAN